MEANTLKWERTAAVLQQYAEFLEKAYKINLKESGRIASHELIDSVSTEIALDGSAIRVELSLASYWKYVEWDTRPHFPPPSAIARWIEIKPIIPRPFKNGKLPTTEQLAFLIARKISKVGTEGSHDMRDALAATNAEYENRIRAAIVEDVGSQFLSFLEILHLE